MRSDSLRRLRGLLPQPFEWVALGMLLAVLVWLRWNRLGLDVSTLAYTAKAAIRVGIFALPLGVVLQALRYVGRREALQGYLRKLVEPAWLIEWLRLWVAVWVTSFAYFWLKVCIPFVNRSSWDAALARADELLHFGAAPIDWVPRILGAGLLTTWIDRWYDVWLVTIVIGLAFFAAAADAASRKRVVFSCVLLWSLGAWIYLAIPAVGPVFTQPESFAGLEDRLPRAHAAQAVLWTNYQQVLSLRSGAGGSLDYRLGVAAMPSLHVAFHVLFALWLWSMSRVAAGIVGALAVLTLIGSVLTGWHYAIDGYAGAALAGLCFAIARMLPPAQGHEADA